MRVLLDTNVISELARPQPDRRVRAFLDNDVEGFLSVVSWHELRYGAELFKEDGKRNKLMHWLDGISSFYQQNLLSVTSEVASLAAVLRAVAAKSGRIIHIEDALIAATAHIFDMILATRNVRDFEMTGVKLLNPWEG